MTAYFICKTAYLQVRIRPETLRDRANPSRGLMIGSGSCLFHELSKRPAEVLLGDVAAVEPSKSLRFRSGPPTGPMRNGRARE